MNDLLHKDRRLSDDLEREGFLSTEEAGDSLVSNEKDVSRRLPWATSTRWQWIQGVLNVILAVTVVVLLLIDRRLSSACPSPLKRTPVPQLPRKVTTFSSDPTYLLDNTTSFNRTSTLHALHRWIPLSSDSRGYVVIPTASSYDLPEPYTIAVSRMVDGPGYMVSVFHQLHCLSYLAEHFQAGYGGVELDEEVAHHAAHCFNYLQQGITCNADTTLEGKTGAGPGEGSEHECVDYEKLLEWANGHAAMKWHMVPDEATL